MNSTIFIPLQISVNKENTKCLIFNNYSDCFIVMSCMCPPSANFVFFLKIQDSRSLAKLIYYPARIICTNLLIYTFSIKT